MAGPAKCLGLSPENPCNGLVHWCPDMQEMSFMEKKSSILQWLLDVYATQGDDGPGDVEREGLLAFFKERSQQACNPPAVCSGALPVAHATQENKDDDCSTDKPVQLSPLIATVGVSTAPHSGKLMWESMSSAPHTDRSSKLGGVSTSRPSGGVFLGCNSRYSPGIRMQLSPPPGITISPAMLPTTVDGNCCSSSSSSSVLDPLLPPSLSPAPMVLCATPADKVVGGNVNEGSGLATPPRQRIPAGGLLLGRPPAAPRNDRCRPDIMTSVCDSGTVEARNCSLPLLRLNHPPKMCPNYTARLLGLAMESTTTTTTTASAAATSTMVATTMPMPMPKKSNCCSHC